MLWATYSCMPATKKTKCNSLCTRVDIIRVISYACVPMRQREQNKLYTMHRMRMDRVIPKLYNHEVKYTYMAFRWHSCVYRVDTHTGNVVEKMFYIKLIVYNICVYCVAFRCCWHHSPMNEYFWSAPLSLPPCLFNGRKAVNCILFIMSMLCLIFYVLVIPWVQNVSMFYICPYSSVGWGMGGVNINTSCY